MSFVSPFVHGIAHYFVVAIVLLLPFLFQWSGPTRWCFLVMGEGVIVYIVLTDYELGLARYLRIRFHLLLNGVFGIAMLAAPRLLSIPEGQRCAIYAIGIAAFFLVATTKARAEGTHQTEARRQT